MPEDLRIYFSAALRRRRGIEIVCPPGMTPGQVGYALAAQERRAEEERELALGRLIEAGRADRQRGNWIGGYPDAS